MPQFAELGAHDRGIGLNPNDCAVIGPVGQGRIRQAYSVYTSIKSSDVSP
jgi:hypothetical protein